MTRMRGWALGSMLLILVASLAGAADADYTVGDFAVNLAKMVTHKADFTPEEAADYLEELGVELSGDLTATVSEAEFVEALNQVGLNLTTTDPAREVSEPHAGQVFQLFDRSDSLFSDELFKLCKGGAVNQNTPCVTDSDCIGGFCQVLQSIKCDGGSQADELCMSDADCPDSFCRIPPGQARKLRVSSPINGD
jgi:hypothetical protein